MTIVQRKFRVDSLWVQVYNSEAEMAEDAADIAAKYLGEVLQQNRTARLMLATGNSQLKFLDALISNSNLDWSKIECFQLDEYLGLSSDHAASFRRYLRDRISSRVTPKAFHYIEGDTLEPLKECDRYSRLLQEQPIDLCLLGIGDNGHLAFNDPDVADFRDPHTVKLVRLDDINRKQQVVTAYFSDVSRVPQYAFTVTIPVICAAKKIICLAPGQRKTEIIQYMLEAKISEKCPASILRQQPQATLFLDTEAAKKLSQ
ncbi:glucosamine-6-phosphate deaminase [Calothrix sp. NIES-3974]|uniref:glucosamine-6-phosphate deaminase n=1 Tax=Calothrix sp. NIES-3974 TaxID=2005462 RepID=UPI000B5EDC5A|nr:glucosamine-6-phosphate deaminase [Calothrix sp. NIES-3974]BAZ06431.1 glucosamine/galactosamine-6-phosphate isomerase [Calothrix sp. NIES-3974]